jgi:mono/diheme cytochrome c family protein
LNMIPPVAVDVIDHTASHPTSVPSGSTVEYGQYLVTSTCVECHGAELNGAPFGPPGQEKPTPNLTQGGELVGWTEQDFANTLRTGVTPSGHQLNEEMPWQYFGQMNDDEIKAMWLYLKSLPAKEQGGIQH